MKKEALINIKGVQHSGGESDETELFTNGFFGGQNGSYYIIYDESEATGYAGCRSTIKVNGNKKVTLMRSGTVQSHLVVEKGCRNIGQYSLPEGRVMVGISAKEIKNELSDNGGELYLRYAIDMNASHVSENEVYITIKEAKGE